MDNQKWTYTVIEEHSGVKVNIPAKGDYMRFNEACEFSGENGIVRIPERWQNGMLVKPAVWRNGRLIEKAVILNRNFYGITEADLGKKITADVKIIRKSNGKETHLMIDITKADGAAAVADLKISTGDDSNAIIIPRTKTWVAVIPRKRFERTKQIAIAA